MKINWGTGIVIAIALFMSFILYFVYKVQTDHQYDNELVVDDYYNKEQLIESTIDAEKNAVALSEKLTFSSTSEGIMIHFPKNMDATKVKGKVALYRPSNQKMDFEIPISLAASDLLIPKKGLAGGVWDVSVNWNYEGKNYLNKEEFYFQ